MNEFESAKGDWYAHDEWRLADREAAYKFFFLAGAAAMRDKAADTCTHMRYATNQYCAAAIRKIEV